MNAMVKNPEAAAAAHEVKTASAEDSLLELMLHGDTLVTIDEETGEVTDIAGAPGAEAGMHELVEWSTRWRAWAIANLEGHKSRRDALIKIISDQTQPHINRYTNLVSFIEKQYCFVWQQFLVESIAKAGTKNDGSPKFKSLKLDWITLKLTANKESIEVLAKEPEAKMEMLKWLKEKCPDAIKTELSVLVSVIPDNLKAELPVTMFKWNKAEGDTFKFV